MSAPWTSAVEVEREVSASMRDGVQLRADVYRPADGSARPALLLRLPYNKTAADADVANCHPAWLASQGFTVVVQDVRGTWASDGEFVPFAHEAEDGFDTIAWVADLPGCDGRVSTYGFSYPGACQLLTAALRPPRLQAMAPAFTNPQPYDGWTYQGGALTGFAVLWAAEFARDAARRAGDAAGFARLQQLLAEGAGRFWSMLPGERLGLVEDHAPYLRDWLSHPGYDEYWARWAVDEDFGRVDAPALHLGGWWDAFARGTVRSFRGLRAQAASGRARERQKLVLGPWRHLPWSPTDGDGTGAREIDDLHIRWFREVVEGRGSGLLDAPVTAYVIGEGWTDLADWPPPEARTERLYLHSEGRANTRFGDGLLSGAAPAGESPDVAVYDPWMAVPRPGGHSCCLDHIVPMGQACQCEAEEWPQLLCYTGPPLPRDLRIVGDVAMTLYASSSAVDTDFCARLCVVDAQGCSQNLLEGIVRARFRDSGREPSPLVPGEVNRYTIDLGPIAIRIPGGSRLRVVVASADYPQWQLNLNDGITPDPDGPPFGKVATQVVFHDAEHPSHLRLPVLAAA